MECMRLGWKKIHQRKETKIYFFKYIVFQTQYILSLNWSNRIYNEPFKLIFTFHFHINSWPSGVLKTLRSLIVLNEFSKLFPQDIYNVLMVALLVLQHGSQKAELVIARGAFVRDVRHLSNVVLTHKHILGVLEHNIVYQRVLQRAGMISRYFGICVEVSVTCRME